MTVLFQLPDEEEYLPKRIRDMHALYGRIDGRTCRRCAHLLRFRRNNTYLKCELNRITHGPATDWRASWPACGQHTENLTE